MRNRRRFLIGLALLLWLAGCASDNGARAPVEDLSYPRPKPAAALPDTGQVVAPSARSGRSLSRTRSAAAQSSVTTAPLQSRQGMSAPETYVVQKGDTLYGIATRFGLEPKQVEEWNHLRAPYKVRIGQVLKLRATQRRAADTPRPETPPAEVAQRAQPHEIHTAVAGAWQWPTDGKVVVSFQTNGKGIEIAGHLGQPIYAAAAGKVVYAGNGLRGYGQLIIIKHDKNLLSAYAFNQQLLVKEGQTVTQGQKIAEMGHSDRDSARLHFEIRVQGKPVDPLHYLPGDANPSPPGS